MTIDKIKIHAVDDNSDNLIGVTESSPRRFVLCGKLNIPNKKERKIIYE